ncbi:MAG TPA: helix-turn-helix domain-containing protein, partial [Bryobacteraceae bacterium]|nr:helix-turn-helix domain-containing protein [Bryobacteraceae bacterium]
RLTSWKEIASYLGVSDKTAQQWEKTRQLPVERVGNRVSISERDLQAWQQSSRTPLPPQITSAPAPPEAADRAWWESRRILKLWSFSSTGILLLGITAGIAYWWSSRAGPPVSVQWQGPVATAVDVKGREVWQRRFPYPLMILSTVAVDILAPWIGDADGDGRSETILPYYHVKREAEGWDLYCISSRGEVLWRLAPARVVSNATSTFRGPYVLRGYSVFPSPERDGTHWTAGVFVHHTEYPAVLLVVDGKGKQRGEFWHAGHLNSLRTLDLDGDGVVELLAGGVQHGAEQAVLVVLDPRRIEGAAQLEPAAHPLQLQKMSKGTEKVVVYFPRTALNRTQDQFNFLNELEIVNGLMQASVYEHLGPPQSYLIYTLAKDFTVKTLTRSVSYINAFMQLRQQRQLDFITGAEEVEGLKKQVRVVRRSP